MPAGWGISPSKLELADRTHHKWPIAALEVVHTMIRAFMKNIEVFKKCTPRLPSPKIPSLIINIHVSMYVNRAASNSPMNTSSLASHSYHNIQVLNIPSDHINDRLPNPFLMKSKIVKYLPCLFHMKLLYFNENKHRSKL